MATLKVSTEVVDMETGKVVETRTSDFHIVPPDDPEACQTCGRRHDPQIPHDKTRLHYQYAFYAEHGRWPTWKDAMAHCSEEMKVVWEEELRAKGAWDGE